MPAATKRGNDIEQSRQPQRFTTAQPLSRGARSQRADHSTNQADRHRESLTARAQAVQLHQRVNGAGNHHRIEAKQQAASAPVSVALIRLKFGRMETLPLEI